MSYRWLCLVGFAAAVLAVPSCSHSSPAVTASTVTASSAAGQSSSRESASPAPSDEPSAPLDSEACVTVTGASLDLSAATSKDEARTAADTLEGFDPPAGAKSAIEHFAGTGGAQIDDPDYSTNNDVLDAWVHQVCPPA
jgi:hypothetical protein